MNTISQTLENKFIEFIFTHSNEEMKRRLSASYKKTLFKLVSNRGGGGSWLPETSLLYKDTARHCHDEHIELKCL